MSPSNGGAIHNGWIRQNFQDLIGFSGMQSSRTSARKATSGSAERDLLPVTRSPDEHSGRPSRRPVNRQQVPGEQGPALGSSHSTTQVSASWHQSSKRSADSGVERPATKQQRTLVLNGYGSGPPSFRSLEQEARSGGSLRIECLKIGHGVGPPDSMSNFTPDGNTSSARCKVLICRMENNSSDPVWCQNKTCQIKTLVGSHGRPAAARISGARFDIPGDQITGGHEDHAGGPDVRYQATISFEPASLPGSQWPPPPLRDVEEVSSNRHVSTIPDPACQKFTAVLDDLLSRQLVKNKVPLCLSRRGGTAAHVSSENDFVLHLGVSWFAQFSKPNAVVAEDNRTILSTERSQINGVMSLRGSNRASIHHDDVTLIQDPHFNGVDAVPTIKTDARLDEATRGSSFAKITNGKCGERKQANGLAHEAYENHRTLNGLGSGKAAGLEPFVLVHGSSLRAAEISDTEFSPSRTRRQKTNISYNLKKMSAASVGRKMPTKSESRRQDSSIANVPDLAGVVFNFDQLKPVRLDSDDCLLCGEKMKKEDALLLHLRKMHPSFDYGLEKVDGEWIMNVVNKSAAPQRDLASENALIPPPLSTSDPAPFSPTLTHRTRAPISAPELDPASGWGHEHMVERDSECSQRVISASLATPIQPERRYHKLEAEFENRGNDAGMSQKIPSQRPQFKRNLKKPVVLAPQAAQPLYDSVSRAIIEPGTELPHRVPDESWILQRSKDNFNDYLDTPQTEIDFMLKWDEFIYPKQISSELYLQREYMAFVDKYASWIAEEQYRMDEFAKHSAMMAIRQIIDDQTIAGVARKIEEARKEVEDRSPQPKETPAPVSSANVCKMCSKPVSVAAMALCSNVTCAHRLHHTSCVADAPSDEFEAEDWLCPHCAKFC